MKKITLLLILLVTSLGFSQSFPLDFSDASQIFDDGDPGVATSIVVDPAGCSADGCSGDVLQIIGSAAQYDPAALNLASYVDLTDSANNTISLEFYAASAGDLLIQFSQPAQESGQNGFAIEINTPVVTGLNSLSLDFDTAGNAYPNSAAAVTLDKYSKISIFVDFADTTGLVQTHFLDNVTGGLDGGLVPNPITELTVDFEIGESDFVAFGMDFGEIDNPDTNGNSSARIAQVADINIGSYSNIQYSIPAGIDLSSGDRAFTMLFKGPRAIPVNLKLEGGTAVEKIANYSGSGDWETLTFDFSTTTVTDKNNIVLFFDIEAAPSVDGVDDIFFFDDFTLGQAPDSGSIEACEGGELVNDFETSDASIFTNFGGGVGTIVDNTDTSVNSSAKVAQYVKNAGFEYGGITIALDSNIDLVNGTFTIDVKSSSVRQLLFKLEGLNQQDILPTSGTGWETLSYDFSAQEGEVTGITLIMDNGTMGDGSSDWTIQFDNIRTCEGNEIVACEGGELVNDFETSDASIFTNFGGGVGTIVDNTDTSVNSSAKVAQYVKNAGFEYGGITIALDSNIDLVNGTFTIDVKSSSVRQLLFKLEGLNQQDILPTSGTGWETLSYDFSAQEGEVTGITLIMDNGTMGDGSSDWTIQFDNIRLCDNGTTGGGDNTACAGTSTVASEGAYSVGYNYSFETVGNDVNVTFELLDTDKPGFNPQIFIQPSTFINMDVSAAPIYTGVITVTAGETINFAIRGAYTGGLVTSQFFDYVVGDDCVPTPDEDNVTLSDLQVDGTTIDSFSGSTVSYDVEVSEGDALPVVSATAAFGTVGTITQASALPGTATFDVTSQSTNFVETYTVNFVFVGPQTAAPTPPVLQPSDVVSIYSDAYAEIPGINYDAGWCEGTGAVTEVSFSVPSSDPTTNLVTNGDFQTGVPTPWTGNGANPVDLGGGNFFNEVNVTAVGNPYDVNLSQEILLNNGSTYTLTFDAFTDNTTGSRTMIAGLGQTGPPYESLTETVTLTSVSQTFTYTFTINYGDSVTDRVIFDMGADTGFVFIDNVSVQEVSTTDSAFAYNGKPCQGITFNENPQNTSGLESGARLNGTINFHVDLYIETGTDLTNKVFNVKVIHPAGAGETEFPININSLSPAPVPGTWYSYDTTVTLLDPTIREVGVTSNLNNEVWYDNLYLYRAGALGVNDFDLNDLNVSPNPTKGVWNINSSNSTIDNVVVYDLLGKRVLNLSPNSQQVTIDGSGLKTGIYLARLSSNGLTKTIKLVKN